jgi:hypothetical protein
MRAGLYLVLFPVTIFSLASCKKNKPAENDCAPGNPVIRTIVNKKATVHLTGTIAYPVYLTELGTIDTRLVPCNFPAGAAFHQEGLQVTISGDVKVTFSTDYGPCCTENLVLSAIVK